MIRKKITIKTFVITAAVGTVFLILLLIIGTFWASKQIIVSTDDAVSAVSSFYLEAMAENNAKTITNLIDSNFDHMDKAIEFIKDEGITTPEELRSALGKVKSLLSLGRFALVDEDNIVYTQYTTYTGGSRHEFLSEETMDDRIISTVYLYGSSKQLCLAVPTKDLKLIGKNFRACFVQIDITDIIELLAFDDQVKTHFGLYSKNGGNISDTELGPEIAGHNLFDAAEHVASLSDREKLLIDFTNEKQGSLTLNFGGVTETLCYVPVQGTGWELVILIRESVIHDQIHSISEKNRAISRNLIIVILVCTLLFATVLLYQFREIAQERLAEEKEKSDSFRSMANTDSMTGVRNKHSYSDKEAELNRMIRENEIQKLAIIVCDINGLKYVNDTKGHAAGDKLIVDASVMICDYFTHGAVYRIGGDEFVVLLQGKGYDTMYEVVNAFNKQIESNIEKDEVVVSIGYSVLKDEDEQLHDVFERADKMMYERKKQLKEMGARTRQ